LSRAGSGGQLVQRDRTCHRLDIGVNIIISWFG
jgi:hypothetical protein